MSLELTDLRVSFATTRGLVEVVKGISLTVASEKVAVVGESGSGKSMTARAILRLLPRAARLSAQRLTLDGTDLLRADERVMRQIRGRRLGLILQDPRFSLNPMMSAAGQIAESWRTHHGGGRKEALEAALDLLSQVQIRDPHRVGRAYPHELSGGMGQRVMIAMMLAPAPRILIADEPTAALDVTVQEGILRLLQELAERRGMGLILISHDLPLVARFCTRVEVMYAGRIVESLQAADLRHAEHPYTRGLVRCLPSLLQPRTRLQVLPAETSWLS